MAIEFFTRKELKYVITMDQFRELTNRMAPYMRVDKNGTDGEYTVSSLYFDSDDKRIYFDTKNKLKSRQKLRLRMYDDAALDDMAFFEIKQKHKKVVYKRRMVLPLHEAYRYMNEEGAIENIHTSNVQVLKEIEHLRNLYKLRPEMIVSYDRKALHGIEDPNFRVTFDWNLRCRKSDLRMENGSYGVNFIDPYLVIMEVKVDHHVPLWLSRVLSDLQCEQRSASKYCTSFETLHDELQQINYFERVGGM